MRCVAVVPIRIRNHCRRSYARGNRRNAQRRERPVRTNRILIYRAGHLLALDIGARDIGIAGGVTGRRPATTGDWVVARPPAPREATQDGADRNKVQRSLESAELTILPARAKPGDSLSWR